MAAPETTIAVPRDDLDDLFEMNGSDNEAFRPVQVDMDAPPPRKAPSRPHTDAVFDEDLQVRKQRQPIAKLDEDKLLSHKGIPKLRRITKERLRFKGKGHEFSDATRLLNLYQLWLDDLYPRAKFADGLVIIEKLGHSKRMQTMRKEWIREGRPIHQETADITLDAENPNSMLASDSREEVQSTINNGEQRHSPNLNGKTRADDGGLFLTDDEDGNGAPEEDELDALLAEDPAMGQTMITNPIEASGEVSKSHMILPSSAQPDPPEDDFADDEEAMAGMW